LDKIRESFIERFFAVEGKIEKKRTTKDY